MDVFVFLLLLETARDMQSVVKGFCGKTSLIIVPLKTKDQITQNIYRSVSCTGTISSAFADLGESLVLIVGTL